MKLKSLLIIGASSFVLASCLKSKDSLGLIGDNGSIVTEIADVNIDGDTKTIALTPDPPSETFTLLTIKSYAARSKKPAGGKVHVKLTFDNTLVTAAGLTVLPANSYTIPALEFDVPSSGEISIPLTLNKAALNLSLSYGLGFKIAEVSEGVISELAKSILVQVVVKNKYDGVYQITSGTLVDANGAYTGYYPGSLYYDASDPRFYSLTTTGANTALWYDEWFPYPTYIVQNIATGGFANTGIKMAFTFDLTTNKITAMVNDANGQVITVAATSKFNPADRSIDVDWTLGRWHVTEHWKFIRER